MREFRKNKEGFLICEECGKCCQDFKGLATHLRYEKIKSRDYYDKWIKSPENGICKHCGKETKFWNLNHGYREYCSNRCSRDSMEVKNKISITNKHKAKKSLEKRKQTCLEKYGVDNVRKSKNVIKATKQSKLEKYGDENYTNLEKNKQTCLEKYGVEYVLQSKKVREKGKQTCRKKYNDKNYNNRKKFKKTCLNKFGVETPFKSSNIKEKSKQTCLKHFNVEYPMQNQYIHNKQQITACLAKKYKYTEIFYRGSFEEDFLNLYYSIFPDIQNAKSIRYLFKEKQKIYHPDFFIPSLNLIIEIKNSYLAKRDKKQIMAKKKATLATCFKYIMIVDKDYRKFEKLIHI